MMKRLSIYLLLLGALLTGCNEWNELLLADSKNQLTVKVTMTSDGAYETRSNTAETTLTARQDTVFVDSDIFVTSTVEARKDSVATTRGVPMQRGGEITSLKIYLFDTGSNSWATSSTLTKEIVSIYKSGAYTNTPSYTWDNQENKITLLAYAPNETSTNGIAPVSGKNYAITYNAPVDIVSQPDICSLIDGSAHMNVINQGNGEHLRTFAFKHKLTSVGFALRGYQVKIMSAVIEGVITKGELDLKTGVWILDNSVRTTMTAGLKDESYEVGYTSWQNCTRTNGYLLLPPQTLTDDAKLTVEYLYNSGEDAGIKQQFTVNLKELTPTWTEGTALTYNIRLKTASTVSTNSLLINDFRKGYTTSSPLSLTGVASDDNLTFTWESSWLKIHRGNPTYGNLPGGAFSGWSTGTGGPWGNLYFYATNDNRSTMSRKATVKVTGKKSLERTFTVTQSEIPMLQLNTSQVNVHSYNNRPWQSGQLNVVSIVKGVVEFCKIESVSADWLHPYFNGNNIAFNYDWNVQASIDRSATFVVSMNVNGVDRGRQTVKVVQQASRFWILLNPNNTFRLGIYKNDTGKNFANEGWRCITSRYGNEVIDTGEMGEVRVALNKQTWVNNANLKLDGSQYWARNSWKNNWGRRFFYYGYFSGKVPNLNLGFADATYSGNRYIRCVTWNQSYLYR